MSKSEYENGMNPDGNWDQIDDYKGLFSDQKSADIILKICFSLVSFVIFLFLAAWHITRKNYRFPGGPALSVISRISDIFGSPCRRRLASIQIRNQFGDLIGCKVKRYMVAVINSISLAEEHRKDSQLDTYYTCAPNSLCNQWNGVLFTSTSRERKIIRKLCLYVFEEFQLTVVDRSVRRVLEPRPSGPLTLGPNLVRQWAWRITFDMLMSDDSSAMTSVDFAELSQISTDLYPQIVGLHCLHTGACGTGSSHCRCPELEGFGDLRLSEVLPSIKQILSPSVRHAMENFEEGADINFITQFIKTKLDFDDQGNNVNFLTVTHLCHLISECALVSQKMLCTALDWTLYLLANRSILQGRLRAEARQLEMMTSASADHILYAALASDSHLPWTKACAHEILRMSCPQGSFDLRKADRDGRLAQFDYREGDLVLFNQFAFHYDPDIWQLPGTFQPERFIDDNGYFAAPEVWNRNFLGEYWVCIPGDFLANVLVVFVSGLCRDYEVLSSNFEEPLPLDHSSFEGFSVLPQSLPHYVFSPV